MAGATRKLGLEIDSQLYSSLDQLARDNGQTRRFLLEDALRFYLGVVVPSRATVRPEVMAQFRRSVGKNRKLLELLTG
jgi:predicted transcriptional regulator